MWMLLFFVSQYARNACSRHIQVVPKPEPKVGAEGVVPPEATPKPLPKTGGFAAASPLGLLTLLPPNSAGAAAPDVAPPPPNSPPGLLAGVLEAPPPKMLDVPEVAPPPNRPEPPDELAPVFAELAVPKSEGVDPPEVLLAAPKRGLFGVLPLPCCPKLKPDMSCGRG